MPSKFGVPLMKLAGILSIEFCCNSKISSLGNATFSFGKFSNWLLLKYKNCKFSFFQKEESMFDILFLLNSSVLIDLKF